MVSNRPPEVVEIQENGWKYQEAITTFLEIPVEGRRKYKDFETNLKMIKCDRLRAKISVRACLINQSRAISQRKKIKLDRHPLLEHCLTCEHRTLEIPADQPIEIPERITQYLHPVEKHKRANSYSWEKINELVGLSCYTMKRIMEGLTFSDLSKKKLAKAGWYDIESGEWLI